MHDNVINEFSNIVTENQEMLMLATLNSVF